MTSIEGTDDGVGFGVKGEATSGDGVVGTTRGMNKVGIRGVHTGHLNAIAISGELQRGTTAVKGQNGGVSGVGSNAVSGSAVWGDSTNGSGVVGTSSSEPGVAGLGTMGVQGFGDPGVQGNNEGEGGGTGVQGISASGRGVWGISANFIATVGDSVSGTGLFGHSQRGTGVFGQGFPAGQFEGDVNVTGILTAHQDVKCDGSMTVRRDILLTNGDVAEDFDVAEIGLQPGTVLCVTDEESLHPCDREYDTRVVGVIAGEGALRPAIVLGRSQASATRAPVALTGRVNCRVDASVNPIVTGDLLTTSARVGYAMRADPHRGPGAIIGKALRSLSNGCGVIPILVALQ